MENGIDDLLARFSNRESEESFELRKLMVAPMNHKLVGKTMKIFEYNGNPKGRTAGEIVIGGSYLVTRHWNDGKLVKLEGIHCPVFLSDLRFSLS